MFSITPAGSLTVHMVLVVIGVMAELIISNLPVYERNEEQSFPWLVIVQSRKGENK
jgi:hypothetical protein